MLMLQNGNSTIDLRIVCIYVLLLLGVGFYVHRRHASLEQYLLAGRSMTTPILICTLASTYYGLDILFGSSELAYYDGLVAFFGYSLLLIGVYLFAALSLSTRLRTKKFTSLPEILEDTYGKNTALVGAVSSLLYSLPTTSLFALGRVCEIVFGIDPRYGALLLGGVGLAYTLLGGLMAVAITDTLQFVLMCITLAVGVPLLMQELGGFANVQAVAPEGYFALFGTMPIWLMIAYASLSISVLIDPGFYQRMFAAKGPTQARNAMLGAIVVWTAYDWLVVAGGMLAMAAVKFGVLPTDLHPNDALFVAVSHALPIALTGIFLAGVLATAMSTMDSYTLVAGANISYDLYRPIFRLNATDEELVRVTKIGVVVSWILAYVIAFAFERIMSLLVFVTSILIAALLVPMMAALFYKGKKSVMAGLLSCSSGLISVLAFYLGLAWIGDYNETFGTYVWTFSLVGQSFSIWREYALFFCVSISLAGFVIGNRYYPSYIRAPESGRDE